MPSMTRAGYTPPKEPDKSPHKRAPQQKKPRKKPQRRPKKRKNTATIVSVVIFLIAACVAAATLYLYAATSPYQDAFLPGTFLGGYPLGGLSYEDGRALLAEQTKESIDGWSYEIAWMDERFALTAADVSLGVDTEKTLAALWSKGREGGMLDRLLAMLELQETPMSARPEIVYSMEAVDALLEAVKAQVECESKDAQVCYTPGSSEPFAFTEEAEGRSLDTTELRAQIEQAMTSLTGAQVELQPQTIRPEVTREQLENAISLRSRAKITLKADEATLSNLRLAAAALNGARIEHGESLSFNDTVGTRSAQRGYVVAPEPAYGENSEGTGGGVCALSSALYQAALLGDVDVESRSAAVRPVAYCEMGQEAAVSDQGLDLVLSNQTDYSLFVSARVYAGAEEEACIEVQLFGEPLAQRYALESQSLETDVVTEPVYVRDHEGRYATYTDERVPAGDGAPGYSALVERIALNAGGEELERRVISEDIYEALAPVVYVGVTER